MDIVGLAAKITTAGAVSTDIVVVGLAVKVTESTTVVPPVPEPPVFGLLIKSHSVPEVSCEAARARCQNVVMVLYTP